MNLKLIKHDLFNISNRVKTIDKNYRIFFNLEKLRYELYYTLGINLSFEICIPFDVLDDRTIELVNKSRVTNFNSIIEEIEENNEKLKLQQENYARENAMNLIQSFEHFSFKEK